MRIARLIDETSVELAVVESVVDSARRIVDAATQSEQVASRITAWVTTAAAIVVGGVVILGLAYGTWSLLEHRKATSSEGDGMPVDESATTYG